MTIELYNSPEVKITVIYDNRIDQPILQEGWGFSSLIEYKGKKILFDTGGNSAAFFSNMEKLKIAWEEIDYVLFSHKHWDHVAGFEEVLKKLHKKTRVYLPKFFPRSLIKKIPKALEHKIVKSFAEIDTAIYSLVLRGGLFLYEQSLILNTSKGLVVLTGCAHPGILNILKTAKKKLPNAIDLVIGGFHLLRTPKNLCAEIVQEFQNLEIKKVAPCHCSGDQTISQFQETYRSNFLKVGTGTVLIS